MIIAVDFDGTLFTNPKEKFPEIGEPIVKIIQWVKKMKIAGNQIILWTCRSGKTLDMAIEEARNHGIEFDAVNENIVNVGGIDTRKIFANIYLDDRALNVEEILNG